MSTENQPLASTLKSPGCWAILLACALASIAVDLVSKQWAFANLADDPVTLDREVIIELTKQGSPLSTVLPAHEPTVVVSRLLELTLVLNKGAVFGIGAGGRWFFVVFTVAAFAFCLYIFGRWTTRNQWFTHACLGMVMGGGFGNLYDRIMFASVRDFLHPLPGVEYPFGISTPWSGTEIWPWVSNVADALLIVGIAGVMIHLFRAPDPGAAEPPAGDTKTDTDTD